jgi:hypothetical protein
MGWGVDVYYTNEESRDNPWPERLRKAGCEVFMDVNAVRNVRDSLCLAMCCRMPQDLWKSLKARGCRLIFSPCMNTILTQQNKPFIKTPPTMLHCQSKYQHSRVWPNYQIWGCQKSVVIPGAFEVDEFPYQPSANVGQFMVGKLARDCKTKWPMDLWEVLGAVRSIGIDLQFLGEGWNALLTATVGQPPEWARCMREDAMTAVDVLARLHCLYCAGQTDIENWPRVGLEAMASGVPIIADRRGGWLEMIEDGVDGILVDGPVESIHALVNLAKDEEMRFAMAAAGREKVRRLSDPSVLGPMWGVAFQDLTTR